MDPTPDMNSIGGAALWCLEQVGYGVIAIAGFLVLVSLAVVISEGMSFGDDNRNGRGQ